MGLLAQFTSREFLVSYGIKTVRFLVCLLSLWIARRHVDALKRALGDLPEVVAKHVNLGVRFVLTFVLVDIVLNTLLTGLLIALGIKHFLSDYFLSLLLTIKVGIALPLILYGVPSLAACLNQHPTDAVDMMSHMIEVVQGILLYVPFFMMQQ